MKKIIYISSLLAFVGVLMSTVAIDARNPLDARLNTYKQECKDLIKPARFEGSRVTYYKLSKKVQYKNIEIFLIMDSEYLFAFSGKECSSKINVRFYDSMGEDRVLIHEEKAIQGKNVVVNSKDLNTAYRKKVPSAERLKNIYIDYEIGTGKEKPEGIVLVIGNK
jgi:hypothetical protein